MGLSLRRFGRSLWEGITPQNEGALRQAEANLARANAAASRPAQYGVLANPQARQQFVQGNQPERFNAPRVYAQVGGDVAINTFLGGAKRFGQDVAGWGLSPMTNRFANQERERAQRLLGPAYENLYRAYGQDPRLGANQASMEADIADYNLRTDPLQRSGIGVNDNVARKVLAHGAEAALDIATAGTGPAAFKASKLAKAGKAGLKATKPSIAAGAALGAAGNLAYTAGQDGASPLDYVVSGGTGAAIGATLPALTGLAGRTSAGPNIKADKPKVSMKPPKQGRTPEQLQVRELNKSIQTQEKLAKNATTPRAQERHLKAKDELIKERAILNRLTKPFKEEDGFARLPGKKDPLESLKQEAKPFIIPKTNPTDVTKLSDKDLQYYGKQGYTSITDKYGNTREIAPVKSDGVQRLDSLNPTGGVFVDYNPKTRATMPLADNMTTYDKTAGKAPDELVTIYRGAPKNQKGIVAGDFITTNRELAKSYTGDGNVLEMQVPASHILDDKTSPLGEEYLYRPTQSQPPKSTRTIEKSPFQSDLEKAGFGARDEFKKIPVKKPKPTDNPLESLKQEARTVYRGGKPFDKKLVGSDGTSFSTDKAIADRWRGSYKGGVTEEFQLAPDTKVFVAPKPEVPLGSLTDSDKFAVVADASRKGYDAVDMTSWGEKEIRVINAGKLTQSQPPKSTLTVEKTKPKVALKEKPAVSPQAPSAKRGQVDSSLNNTPKTIDDELEGLIYGKREGPDYKVSGLGKMAEALSLGRQTRKLTSPIEETINKGIRTSLESGNSVTRTPGRAIVGVSRQAGKTAEEMAQFGKFQGEKEIGDVFGKKIAKMGDEAAKSGVRKEAIAAALDPELARARGDKIPKLTKAEAVEAERLRKIIDLTHEGEYQIGRLDKKVYEKNKGTYFPRDFTEFFNDDATRRITRDNKLELNIFKGRKELSDIPKEVIDAAQTDPYYMAALRVQQYEKNKAFTNYSDWLSKNGSVSDTPIKGFVQVPDNPAYGSLAGKHVLKEQLEDLQGFIYETSAAQHAVALLEAYDRNPLRRGRKMVLTVYNPGVRLGNRTFNYLVTSLNGINPVTFTKNYSRGRKMIKSNSPEFLEATRSGIFGSSIIDKELYKTGSDLKRKAGKPLKAINDIAGETYNKVDDEAKMAAWLTFKARGLSTEEAAARTKRMLQNYDMVGNIFDLGAKTPIGGNAFIRFSSELMRIAHNTAIDNPVRAAGAAIAAATLVNTASRLSGESPEDKKTREGRLGAPRIPFTNQSLEVQTPWGAINAGRLIGLTTYNDLGGGIGDDADRLLPFTLPVQGKEGGGLELNPKFVTSDPLLGPVMSQIIDKDFRGKKISDPENQGQFREDLPADQQRENRLKHLGMAYMPLGNEIDSLISAARGKENYYGKVRSLPQAALRTAGIKVEQFGPEQAKEQRAIDKYFEDKKVIDAEAAKMSPEAADAYKRQTGYWKTREQVANEFKPGEKRYKKEAVFNFPEDKWKDFTSHPELYNLIEKKKLNEAKDGKPLQPEFDPRLSRDFRIQLVNNKSLAPGEDVEADERMYSNPEWDLYNQIKDEYTAKAKAYYPEKDGEFVDELVKHKQAKFPEKGAAKKAYDEAYGKYAKGQGPKPAYTDAVDADKQAYTEAKRVWTNQERKARGLPPISKEVWDNVTFGFESDEEKVYKQLKYGKGYGGGYGGYGSGGSKSPNVSSVAKYAIDPDVGGKAPKASISVKTPAKVGVAKKTSGKPKLSIKKSLV